MGKKALVTTLDEYVVGKLPDKVLDAFDDVQLSYADVIKLNAARPALKITVDDGSLSIYLNATYSVKKVLAALCGAITAIWVVISFVIRVMPQIIAQVNPGP